MFRLDRTVIERYQRRKEVLIMPTGELLGFIAGAICTASLIPQIIRVFKLKSAREISLLFTTLMLLGFFIWIAYGISFRLPPVIFWNAIAAILAGALLFAKLKYGR
jgi:MtN3 and saliva related transmembrane protein|tara:strand:- start:210 stop:527 length:318 start_codon:yes stop_codon:yes gene_type:complete